MAAPFFSPAPVQPSCCTRTGGRHRSRPPFANPGASSSPPASSPKTHSSPRSMLWSPPSTDTLIRDHRCPGIGTDDVHDAEGEGLMGLIGGMARTAVIAGTATAVSNRVSRRQANRWASQEQYDPYQGAPQQQYAP